MDNSAQGSSATPTINTPNQNATMPEQMQQTPSVPQPSMPTTPEQVSPSMPPAPVNPGIPTPSPQGQTGSQSEPIAPVMSPAPEPPSAPDNSASAVPAAMATPATPSETASAVPEPAMSAQNASALPTEPVNTNANSTVSPSEIASSPTMPNDADVMKNPSDNHNPPQMHADKHGHISPWTLALIVVLAGFAAFFLYIAFNPQFKLPFGQKKQEVLVPTPTPVAFSTLALEEAPTNADAAAKTTNTKTRTYNIMINTHQNTVNAVQLELSYDPSVLTDVTITPGTFFASPLQLVKDVDVVNGRISYALGTQPKDKGLQGTGVVAQITFQINPAAKGPTTMLKFLPKTLIAGQGINPSVLKSTTNGTIMLVEPTPTTATAPSGAMKPTTSTPAVTGTQTKPIGY